MSTPDLINGTIEFAGSLAAWVNLITLWKDRGYAGISIPVMAFFAGRSLWRGYFYWHLHQPISGTGGLSNGFAYVFFVVLMLYFGKKKWELYR